MIGNFFKNLMLYQHPTHIPTPTFPSTIRFGTVDMSKWDLLILLICAIVVEQSENTLNKPCWT